MLYFIVCAAVLCILGVAANHALDQMDKDYWKNNTGWEDDSDDW